MGKIVLRVDHHLPFEIDETEERIRLEIFVAVPGFPVRVDARNNQDQEHGKACKKEQVRPRDSAFSKPRSIPR